MDLFVDSLARHLSIESPTVYFTTLAVLGSLVARVYEVINPLGKAEPLCSYLIIGRPPSGGKTILFTHLVEPILEQEKNYNAEITKYNDLVGFEIMQAKAELKRLGKSLTSNRVITSLRDLTQNMMLEIKTNMPVSIAPLQFFGGDVTMAGLANLQNQQKGFIAIAKAEPAMFNNLSSIIHNMDLLLSGFDKEQFDKSRSRENIRIEAPRTNIIAILQPMVLYKLLKESQLKERGFLSRLYCLCIEQPLERQPYVEPMPNESQQWFNTLISHLFQMAMKVRDDNASMLSLQPSTEASRILRQAEDNIKFTLSRNGQLEYFKDLAGRFATQARRMGAVLHVIEGCQGTEISADTMQIAAHNCQNLLFSTIDNYLEAHKRDQVATYNKKWGELYLRILDEFMASCFECITDYDLKRRYRNAYGATMVMSVLNRLVHDGKIQAVIPPGIIHYPGRISYQFIKDNASWGYTRPMQSPMPSLI